MLHFPTDFPSDSLRVLIKNRETKEPFDKECVWNILGYVLFTDTKPKYPIDEPTLFESLVTYENTPWDKRVALNVTLPLPELGGWCLTLLEGKNAVT